MRKLSFVIFVIFLITCNENEFDNNKSTSKGLDNTVDAVETNIMNKDDEALFDVDIVKESFKSTEYDSSELVLNPLKGRSSEQITMVQTLTSATPQETSDLFKPSDNTLTIWQGQNEGTKTEDLEITKIDRPVDILVVMDRSGTMDKVREAVSTKLNDLITNISDLDWKVAVRSTYAANADWSKQCVTVISKGDQSPETAFKNAISGAQDGDTYEQGILSSLYGLFNEKICPSKSQSWLRKNSFVVVLIVSDEDDSCHPGCLTDTSYCAVPNSSLPTSKVTAVYRGSNGDPINFFIQMVENHLNKKREQDIVVHGILNEKTTGTACGVNVLFSTYYRQFIRKFPGYVIAGIGRNGETVNTSNLDFSKIFQEISKSTFKSVSNNFKHTLAEQPSEEDEVQVYLDGVPMDSLKYSVSGKVVDIHSGTTITENNNKITFEYYAGKNTYDVPENISTITSVKVNNQPETSYTFKPNKHQLVFKKYLNPASKVEIGYSGQVSKVDFNFTRPVKPFDENSVKVYGVKGDKETLLSKTKDGLNFDTTTFKLTFNKDDWNAQGYTSLKLCYNIYTPKYSYQTAVKDLKSLKNLKLENSSGAAVGYTIVEGSDDEIKIKNTADFEDGGVLTLSWDRYEDISKINLNHRIKVDSLKVDCPSPNNASTNTCPNVKYTVDYDTNTVNVSSGLSKTDIVRLSYGYVSNQILSYTLSTEIVPEQDSMQVVVDNKIVNPTEYSVEGNTLTFNKTLPVDANVDVKIYKKKNM